MHRTSARPMASAWRSGVGKSSAIGIFPATGR
jgi:hypothetical protein